MQEILSVLLILIMTALPMLSVSASVNTCQHSVPESTISDVQTNSYTAMDMDTMEDCCHSPAVSCDHGSACDCDNVQAGYSVVASAQDTFVDQPLQLHKQVILDLFVSKVSESLYRPPITPLTKV
jgi:hypothetical protein